MTPELQSPANLLNEQTFGSGDRSVMCDIDGKIVTMKESELLCLRGGSENDNEVVRWVQYHLLATGALVHRSAHVHLKKAYVFAEAVAAELG